MTDRRKSRVPSPGISRDAHATFVPGAFSTQKCRALIPTGAGATTPGVRPASRPCVRRGLPSARFLQARQFRLRRRSGEGSEHGRRSLGPPREMSEDFLAHTQAQSRARRGVQMHTSTKRLRPLPHAAQPETAPLLTENAATPVVRNAQALDFVRFRRKGWLSFLDLHVARPLAVGKRQR